MLYMLIKSYAMQVLLCNLCSFLFDGACKLHSLHLLPGWLFAATSTCACRMLKHGGLQVEDFYPMIYLEGVLNNGTDLALPANLTSDRRALLATTPVYGEPLLAGNHSVLVSLNGQQLSGKLAAKETAVSLNLHNKLMCNNTKRECAHHKGAV